MERISDVLTVFTFFIMSVLLIACVSERTYRDVRTRLFSWMLGLDLVILVTEGISISVFTRQGTDDSIAGCIAASVFTLALYAILVVYCEYSTLLIEDLTEERVPRSKWVVPICMVNSLLCCSLIWADYLTGYVTPPGIAPFLIYILCHAGGWYIGIHLVLQVLLFRDKLPSKTVFSLLILPVIPFVTSFLRLLWPSFAYLALALSASLFLTYNFLFWEQHRELVRQHSEQVEEQMDVMISEIGPHFIYNVLNSIYYLCGKDPDKAQEAVGEFSEYLRANLDGVEERGLITGEQELSHVEHYLNLEKMRFGEELHIEKDIRTTQFMIPPLTLQPMVENAIKHGVMQREEGGTVRISTWDVSDATVIRIEDDGVGFDPAQQADDGKSHIGIRNVRERLWAMCRATLKISSRPGEGTAVTIELPRDPVEWLRRKRGDR